MASGGGPGAMEATHLGAWFAGRDDAELNSAIAMLKRAPSFQPKEAWLDSALEVVHRFPAATNGSSESLGIPTFFYGHEPPTCFALHIAKYFANSIREDGLLAIATSGVVFAPGSAGTVQEIFQDGAQNHYCSVGDPAPMVLFGELYWKCTVPVFPLLAQMAAGRDWARLVACVDTRSDVLQRLVSFRDERRGAKKGGTCP
jgi:predicted Rossmann-fold nucleotide-binding protein